MDTKNSKWNTLYNVSNNFAVMSKREINHISYALLYRHTFNFLTPCKLLESEVFNIKYKNPKDINTTAEKLRYYRYKKALLQKDVAKQIGINLSTYVSYESIQREYYPIEELVKISHIYKVDITELLDEYNLFLYKGQGLQLKKLRTELGITQKIMADKLNVHSRTVRQWEKDRVRMLKNTYIKIFKDKNFLLI